MNFEVKFMRIILITKRQVEALLPFLDFEHRNFWNQKKKNSTVSDNKM